MDDTLTTAPLPDGDGPKRLGRRQALGLLGGAGATAVIGTIALLRSNSSSNDAADTAGSTGASTDGTVASTSTTAVAAADPAASTTTTDASTTGGQADGTTTTTEAASADTTTTTAANVKAVGAIPQETAGPYPGDGTNGPNVLTSSGIMRSDIRPSFGSSSTVATGVLLGVAMTLVKAGTTTPLPGAAVYIWHCDAAGRYSLYNQGVTGENYLRGVQVADAGGVVRFTTIFPADYSGRWPHIHFEVFDSLARATTGRNATRTSQMALPASVCQAVYATSGYPGSAQNMASESLSTDMVFADGVSLQTPTMSGSVSSGYLAQLTVGI